MFSRNIISIYRVCDKIIYRSLRSRRLEVKTPNPGLDKRVQAFRDEGLQILDNDAEEFVEQSESDFLKVGEAYNEHINETFMGKHQLRQHIIKEKYFKENMPNLLTWSEKEQIRHLNNTQPDEWTPHKLAESFPVTEPVVKKLLKYAWNTGDESRIARHDASAMRNWKELKEGTLNIPEDLREHFLKFSERKIPPLQYKPQKVELKKTVENMGEYEKIIQRCAAKENLDATGETNAITMSKKEKPENIKKDNKRITLHDLSEKIKRRIETYDDDVNLPDKIIASSVTDSQSSTLELTNNLELYADEKNLVSHQEKKKESNIMEYPERIRIPKKAYKMGATYKVDDCYYDHDGKFLYRVLGMTN